MSAPHDSPTCRDVTDLAARLRSKPILVAPGVYDPLSALIAEQAGCEAVFVSGGSVAMTQLARPDFGLLSATDLADLVARICDRVGIPVFVDGDQGFGNAAHVQRLVRALARAGAAAVQIEDQIEVKPGADVRARPLIPAAQMVAKIKAAQDARPDDQFLISARTDALATAGLDDALARGEAYVEAGCDLLFVESIKDRAHATEIAGHFASRVPLVINMAESIGAPFANAHAAQSADFSLALFPATALGAAAHGLQGAYASIVRDGASGAVQSRMVSSADMNALIGTAAFAERIAGYGGTA